jgi:hypothetical protein
LSAAPSRQDFSPCIDRSSASIELFEYADDHQGQEDCHGG